MNSLDRKEIDSMKFKSEGERQGFIRCMKEIEVLVVRVRSEMKERGFSKKDIDLYFSSGEFVRNLRPVWNG